MDLNLTGKRALVLAASRGLGFATAMGLAREGADASRTMSDAEVARFIAHYERITGQVLSEMPPRTDLLFRLDAERRPVG